MEGDSSTRTWILTLVRNRAIDVVRARQRRPVQPLDDTVDPPDSADVPLQAMLNVDAARVAEALHRLPPEQREVIQLAYTSGLSHAEIAAKHGLEISERRLRRVVEAAEETEPEETSAWRRVLEQTTSVLLRQSGQAS